MEFLTKRHWAFVLVSFFGTLAFIGLWILAQEYLGFTPREASVVEMSAAVFFVAGVLIGRYVR